MQSKVLIVDDEKDICFLISEILKDEKFITSYASNSSYALKLFYSFKPDLVILDVWLGKNDMDGIQLLKKFKTIDSSIPVIIISGHGTVDMAVNAIKNGAYDFLEKPFNSDKIIILSNRAVENAKLINENIILKKIAEPNTPIIGKSNFIHDLKNILNKIKFSSSRVLISGPMGSGKKLIAQTIHLLSKRKNSLANIVDFSMINQVQIHELFTEKIDNIKNNIFYKSNNGTLIFKDIEKIPIEFQKKILFFIEKQNFYQNININSDIKIISISSANLNTEILNGNFIKDLFSRLNVIRISIPPIKDRREDILPICNHYLDNFNKNKNNKFFFSNFAISRLESYDWPGNTRQIVNYIEKVVILNQGLNLSSNYEIDELPKDMGEEQEYSSQEEGFSLSLKEAREKFEKEYLLSQIKRFNGNIPKISDFTGMERTALYRKFKSLNINLEKK